LFITIGNMFLHLLLELLIELFGLRHLPD
jgi:hypothetical protein